MASEKRLIWGDIAEEHLRKLADRWHGSFSGDAYERAAQEIAEMPTVDAVEAVRCKDCKWWNTEETDLYNRTCRCERFSLVGYSENYTQPTDFCSYGERKDNATTITYADLVPHGRWEKVIPSKSAAKWSSRVSCSVCHKAGYERYSYCPNCGADMRGKDNDG